ncbi:formate dehydrogenase accessory sulfurtransferase FdhD [Sporosalibacterium faouarense]|uniref:formate dehydrogenase accessory sulfurtransferase FdhD n=1 Tax=Sporosalibacterium faouarense TaxID=516123 RepID=UPI00192BBAC6|nr:formate dehydrogenase accessory sulfurtransferase FdhD [Sporosalibacterium faouarense]
MKNIKSYNILKIKGDEVNEIEDKVVVEYPFTIYLDNEEFITLLCTPKSLRYLAIGFLQSEGIIDKKEDIEKIDIDEERGLAFVNTTRTNSLSKNLSRKRTITTGCGKGTIFYNVIDSFKTKKISKRLDIDKDNIYKLMTKFNEKSKMFLETGGVHSCALCKNNQILIFEEDIGRHNALDKILGRILLEEIKLEDKFIVTSGRITSEILIKASMRSISTIISRSAPTNLSIDMAKELNITLIGFARGKKMNMYTNFPSLNS